MSILPIVKIPDPILRVTSQPVERVDAALESFLEDMLETMYDAPGIGLAAIQVGEARRIFTVDCEQRTEDEAEADSEKPQRGETANARRNPIILINPEIVAFTDTPSVYEEGCLSIPDYYADVERPEGCTVKYLDRHGKQQILEATGLLSTCIQHEFDHLNGTLFIDHISKLKRDMVIRKFTKLAKQNGTRFVG